MYRQKSLSLTSDSQPVILVWKPARNIKEITNFVKEKAGLLLVGVLRKFPSHGSVKHGLLHEVQQEVEEELMIRFSLRVTRRDRIRSERLSGLVTKLERQG